MRIEELMIGDLVECIYYDEEGKEKSFYANISAIDSDSTLLDGTKAFLVEDSEVEEIDTCLPISIIAEILKENGFTQVKNEKNEYHKHLVYGYISVYIEKENAYIHYHNHEVDSLNIKRRYVHELQHALRLCGLNLLANNFKI